MMLSFPKRPSAGRQPNQNMIAVDDRNCRAFRPVFAENLIRIDCVTESPNVNGDDRALLPLPDPVRLAVQVEEPT